MMNKYRVHEVAKDFKLNSKDIAEIMTKYLSLIHISEPTRP